jgi:Fe-S-cluster containining protein
MTFDEVISRLSEADQKVIKEILALFDAIDRQTEEFSKETGLKCKKGCGACCTNPDIETTVAEVLPLAAYLWAQGLAESKLELFRDAINGVSTKGVCVFYEPDLLVPTQGRCGIYAYRPGLCRLFGFSGRKDKYGKSVLVTCKVIKESHAQECQLTQAELQKGNLTAPLLATHAFSVAGIDPVHGNQLLPINQAIAQAIEKVGYRK